jgi:hypothetical protein
MSTNIQDKVTDLKESLIKDEHKVDGEVELKGENKD